MENENGRSYFFRDLIVKILLVLLFIFLLMWLVPMPNLNPFYDKVFTENLSNMTDAAKGYYTVSRLPQKEGESSKLTLKDMLDNKMIIEFTDSKGNKCDVNNSYVEVTKKDGEYTFKTNLKCGSDEDYVIEYYGCYDVCTDGKCQTEVVEKPSNETKKITEYEFSKTTKVSYVEKYVCKEGYTLQGNKCIKPSSIEKVEDANIKCLTGYNYNSSTKKCEKSITTEENAKLKCPTGYVYSSDTNKCTKGINNLVDAAISYKCAKGTLNADNKCVINGIKETDAEVSYKCSSGTLQGTECVTTTTVDVPATCVYAGEVCSNVTTGGTTGNGLYPTPGGYVSQVCTPQYSCTEASTRTSTSKTSATKVYSCTTGTRDSSGVKCITNTTKIEEPTIIYNCPAGTKDSTGTKCEITNVNETNPTYYCEKGSLNGTKCNIASIDKIDPTYYCNSKYTLAGNKCYYTTTDIVDATAVNGTKDSTIYKWSRSEKLSGWTRTGKIRTVNVNVTSK